MQRAVRRGESLSSYQNTLTVPPNALHCLHVNETGVQTKSAHQEPEGRYHPISACLGGVRMPHCSNVKLQQRQTARNASFCRLRSWTLFVVSVREGDSSLCRCDPTREEHTIVRYLFSCRSP